MPATALEHFQQDVARARAIVAHAEPLPSRANRDRLLRGDLLRSAWMFAVGALDAYFCDAYTDVIAAILTAKSSHANSAPPGFALPEDFLEIRFPIRAILEPYSRTNWRWRMAAREMMSRENVLRLQTIQELFNKFFRPGHRLFGDVIRAWIAHPAATRWLFGITGARFSKLAPRDQDGAARRALDTMKDRFKSVFQRRHDCIHNCDRPRISPQPLDSTGPVLRIIDEIEFLVRRCDEHINTELRQFLSGLGCPLAIVTRVGY